MKTAGAAVVVLVLVGAAVAAAVVVGLAAAAAAAAVAWWRAWAHCPSAASTVAVRLPGRDVHLPQGTIGLAVPLSSPRLLGPCPACALGLHH